MPRMYGGGPNISTIPGRDDALSVRLDDDPPPPVVQAVEGGDGACECDITGVFWYDAETDDYDADTLFHDVFFEDLPYLYVAKIKDAVCLDATISLSSSWSGDDPEPVVMITDHVVSVAITDGVTGLGTLTVGGSIDCGDGPVTLEDITLALTTD